MHIDDEDLILIYYEEQARPAHLDACGECAARFAELSADLPRLGEEMPVPALGEDYGRWAWFRLREKLPRERTFPWRSAAVAAAILVAFLAGRYSMDSPASALVYPVAQAGKANARVYRASLGQHLERSQLVLREIENAPDEAETDLSDEQERAGRLLTPNRLYRQEAAFDGDAGTARVLEDLERILLEVAHWPAKVSGEELRAIRDRIREQGITFRVKVEEARQEVLEQ